MMPIKVSCSGCSDVWGSELLSDTSMEKTISDATTSGWKWAAQKTERLSIHLNIMNHN